MNRISFWRPAGRVAAQVLCGMIGLSGKRSVNQEFGS